jgi:sRNA-binding regulator protein Hfq
LSDKTSVLDKKNITVYFGSFYINGYVDFDIDDRIIVSDKNGDSTVIFRNAISAITVHNNDKLEEDEPKEKLQDKPFIIFSGKKQNLGPAAAAAATAVEEDDFSENKYDSGMYIPESVLRQDPLNTNIHHTDDFSVSFGGRTNINFTSEE